LRKKLISQNNIVNSRVRQRNTVKRQIINGRVCEINKNDILNCYDINVELDNDVLFTLMLRAHEENITFNQLATNILHNYIKKHEGINNDNNNEGEETTC